MHTILMVNTLLSAVTAMLCLVVVVVWMPRVVGGNHTLLLAGIVVGFAGAFTTWSTFMLDIYLAYELKRHKEAAINLVMSLGIGLLAAWCGLQLA